MAHFYQRAMTAAAAAAGTVALPVAADAALVTKNQLLGASTSDAVGTTAWDVDGDGQVDFTIVREDSAGQWGLHLTSAGQNGLGFVGADSAEPGIIGLSSGFRVGPTLASHTWGAANVGSRLLAAKTVSTFSPGEFGSGWVVQREGDTKVGFSFISSGNILYGWAVFDIQLDTDQADFSIKQWTYETEPDTAVSVGTTATPVPLAGSGLHALALLGLGAAGMRALRRRY